MKKARIIGALACAAALIPTGSAVAQTTPIIDATVPRQLEGTAPTAPWVIYTRTGTPATAATFVDGGLQLTTMTSSEKVYAFNFEHVGAPLADVTTISYSTNRLAGAAQQVAALNLQVDVNGPAAGGFTTLVFEPVYNADQGLVVNGTTQTWDAYKNGDARWWSSRDIAGVCAFNCFVSWDDILAANPAAVIVGGVGINQGSGNPGLTTTVNDFRFGTRTYDFEPTRTPASKDDCKNGGWAAFNTPTFKNQGDCVSYIASGRS